MRVILKQDVENLGRKGDIVGVAPGYGRNFLIPKKIALEVTPSNMKMIEIEQQALKKELEKERASYKDLIEKLNATSLSFQRKAGEKDVIFGSVSAADIKDALQELGFDIDRKKILLDEPIKRLGNYTVAIKIFHEDRAEIKVGVVTEEGQEKEKKEEVAGEEPAEKEEAKVEPDEEKKEEIEGKREEGKDEEGVESKEEKEEPEEAIEMKEEKDKDEEEKKKDEASGQIEDKADTLEGPEKEEEKAQKEEDASAEKTKAEEKEKSAAEGKKEKKEKKKKKKGKEKLRK